MTVQDLTFDANWLDQIRTQISQVQLLESVDSTNEVLKRRFDQGQWEPCLVIADQQTAGKGRMGRTWVSPLGANLHLSLSWRLPGECTLDGLSLAVGLSLVACLEGLGIHSLQIKWPNDLLLKGKKVAGILTEVLSTSSAGHLVVIGIGLNVFKPDPLPSIDQPWTYLAKENTFSFNRAYLCTQLIEKLLLDLNTFMSQGWSGFAARWPQYDAMFGKALTANQSVRLKVLGVGQGVDERGALLVLQSDGSLVSVVSGEVNANLS